MREFIRINRLRDKWILTWVDAIYSYIPLHKTELITSNNVKFKIRLKDTRKLVVVDNKTFKIGEQTIDAKYFENYYDYYLMKKQGNKINNMTIWDVLNDITDNNIEQYITSGEIYLWKNITKTGGK